MAKKKSDLSRAFSEDGELKTHVGGQALIEGIMMRGRYNWAVAVREPSGNIYLEEHDLASGKKKNGWMYWPVVRGCRSMVESLGLGFKALMIATMHAYDEEGETAGQKAEKVAAEDPAAAGEELQADAPADVEDTAAADVAAADAPADGEGAAVENGSAEGERPFSWKDDFGRPDTMIDALGAQRTLEVVEEPAPAAEPAEKPEKKSFWDEEVEFTEKDMMISMAFGVVLAVVLFIIVPAGVTNLIVGEYDEHTLLWNIVDGVLRVGVFVFYIWLIGRMSDIKRMFAYHGAEHKTIHCYEHGLPLTPENARSFPRLHVRCGTAFLIMVMIVAILVYSIVPLKALIAALGVTNSALKLVLVVLVRILFLPLIAGLSYEITVKWAGSHPENPLVKIVLWPGLQMQYLTTSEPDDGMLECAIAAMQLVLEREEREAAQAAATAAAAAAAEAGA